MYKELLSYKEQNAALQNDFESMRLRAEATLNDKRAIERDLSSFKENMSAAAREINALKEQLIQAKTQERYAE